MEHINKQLPVVVKNLELQKQENGPPETSNFSIALAAKKIKDQPEIELRKALRYVMIKVGLRGANFPAGPDKALLINHIYDHYGNHTPEEIILAFDMALSGKIAVEINCFENFSCAYFSQIMNAYRVWAAAAAKELEKKIKVIEEKPDIEQIEKEYQEFLKSPLAKKYKPNG